MFSFSYAIYLPGAIIILSIFTRSSIRKYLLLIAFGFVLPHLVLICIFNLNGHAQALWQNYYVHNLSFPAHDLMSTIIVVAAVYDAAHLPVCFIVHPEPRCKTLRSTNHKFFK
jgi:hypothetical protein